MALDSLYTWVRAVEIIRKETGIEAEDEPIKAIKKAKDILRKLKSE